jgi:hypothetical protein
MPANGDVTQNNTLQAAHNTKIVGHVTLWSSARIELSWVYLTADNQSTRSSWYRALLWGPWRDFILILSLVTIALLFSSCRATSLTRGLVCNLQCRLVRSLRTNSHTLPSHLRLCSLFVASYDSQGLRWRYSNRTPHGDSARRHLRGM